MTVQTIRGTEVKRPVPDRLKSTLFDHAEVVEIAHFGLRNNEGMWPSYNCLDLLVPTTACPEPAVGAKEFRHADWQGAFEFAVYGGVECSAVGLDKADQDREVKRVFQASESKGVEMALALTRFADQTSGDDFPWADTPDLTPGAAVSLPVALALLEGDAAYNYVGTPTLHVPRAAATILSANGLIVWKGDKAYTLNGSKVAMGGGYDDPAMLASGKWTMYASGEVYIERSQQIDQTVYVVPGSVSGAPTLSENTVISFAERMYRVVVDCYTASVTGTAF